MIPLAKACDALAINRSIVYWWQGQSDLSEEQMQANRSGKKCRQSRAPTAKERSRLLKLFNSDEFVAPPPMEIYHTPGAYITLYVVLDLFSRFVVAWTISRKEISALAQQHMNEATHRYCIMCCVRPLCVYRVFGIGGRYERCCPFRIFLRTWINDQKSHEYICHECFWYLSMIAIDTYSRLSWVWLVPASDILNGRSQAIQHLERFAC